MNILDQSKDLLREAGYTLKSDSADSEQLYFEDDSVFGLLIVFNSVPDLLAGWEQRQTRFFQDNARQLQLHPEKAWNAYCVLLSPGQEDETDKAGLRALEEDFHASRKIARGGVRSFPDLRRALAPLLHVRYAESLGLVDIGDRLRNLIPETVLTGLQEGRSPKEIANGLLELE